MKSGNRSVLPPQQTSGDLDISFPVRILGHPELPPHALSRPPPHVSGPTLGTHGKSTLAHTLGGWAGSAWSRRGHQAAGPEAGAAPTSGAARAVMATQPLLSTRCVNFPARGLSNADVPTHPFPPALLGRATLWAAGGLGRRSASLPSLPVAVQWHPGLGCVGRWQGPSPSVPAPPQGSRVVPLPTGVLLLKGKLRHTEVSGGDWAALSQWRLLPGAEKGSQKLGWLWRRSSMGPRARVREWALARAPRPQSHPGKCLG